jgi:hypothetical protein
MQGVTVIAIHTAFAEDDVEYVIQQAGIKAVFCSEDLLSKFKSISDRSDTLRSIVTFSPLKGKTNVRLLWRLNKLIMLVNRSQGFLILFNLNILVKRILVMYISVNHPILLQSFTPVVLQGDQRVS